MADLFFLASYQAQREAEEESKHWSPHLLPLTRHFLSKRGFCLGVKLV